MSWASHRKAVHDASRPLPHRASHLRSCAMHVARMLGVAREVLFSRVRAGCGVDMERIADAQALLAAMAYLESVRPRSNSALPRQGAPT